MQIARLAIDAGGVGPLRGENSLWLELSSHVAKRVLLFFGRSKSLDIARYTLRQCSSFGECAQMDVTDKSHTARYHRTIWVA